MRTVHSPGGPALAGSGGEASGNRGARLKLLSGFELSLGGRPMLLPVALQRLLAFLALSGQRLRRSYVAGRLWIDATEERAGANLRSTLWRLRQLEQALVEASAAHLSLSSAVSVDILEAQMQVTRLTDPADGCEDLTVDVGVLCSDVLPDWYDEWVIIERERFRQMRLHGLESVSHRLIDAKRYGEAVDAALAAVSAEPLRESAQRVLISAHLAEGNFGEALRQFRRFSDTLRDELGMEPSNELAGLLWPSRALADPHGVLIEEPPLVYSGK